jgi:hypothetical protein
MIAGEVETMEGKISKGAKNARRAMNTKSLLCIFPAFLCAFAVNMLWSWQ